MRCVQDGPEGGENHRINAALLGEFSFMTAMIKLTGAEHTLSLTLKLDLSVCPSYNFFSLGLIAQKFINCVKILIASFLEGGAQTILR